MQPEATHATALDWAAGMPGAVTVCDRGGTCLYLNQRAAAYYASSGGFALIGQNMLDCHPEAARAKFEGLLATGQANIYTIEKEGARKLVYQSPWYRDGEYAGIVELLLDLPAEMPHFVRG